MSKGAAKKAESAAQMQAGVAQQELDIGKQLITETAPARQQAISTFSGLAGGNVPGITKYTAPQINAADQQFAQAEKAALAMPPGGMRDQALRDIALQKAAAKNQILSGGMGDALTRLASLGMGGTQAGISTLGTAGQTFGQSADIYNQMASSKGAMAGQGAGAAGGIVAAAIAA